MSEDKDGSVIELGDFVSETIQSIVRGTVEAQAAVKDMGAAVSPGNAGYREAKMVVSHETSGPVSIIHFDVGLTATAEKSRGGKIGVAFGSIGAGVDSSGSNHSATSASVSFDIALALPVDPASNRRRS